MKSDVFKCLKLTDYARSSVGGRVVGTREYQTSDPGQAGSIPPWLFTFSFICLKNTPSFVVPDELACVSMHPVTNE